MTEIPLRILGFFFYMYRVSTKNIIYIVLRLQLLNIHQTNILSAQNTDMMLNNFTE